MPLTEWTHLDELPGDSPMSVWHYSCAWSIIFALPSPIPNQHPLLSLLSFTQIYPFVFAHCPPLSLTWVLGVALHPVCMVLWFLPACACTTLLPERTVQPTSLLVSPWLAQWSLLALLASSADVAMCLLTGLFCSQSTPSYPGLLPWVGAVYFTFSTSCHLPQDLAEKSYPSALASLGQSYSVATSGPWAYAVVTLNCSALLLPQVLASIPMKLSEGMSEWERERIYMDLAILSLLLRYCMYEKCYHFHLYFTLRVKLEIRSSTPGSEFRAK